MNEPWLRFALSHKAIYLLIIAAGCVGAWFYAGWPMVLTMVGFTVAVGLLGYAWAWAHRGPVASVGRARRARRTSPGPSVAKGRDPVILVWASVRACVRSRESAGRNGNRAKPSPRLV